MALEEDLDDAADLTIDLATRIPVVLARGAVLVAGVIGPREVQRDAVSPILDLRDDVGHRLRIALALVGRSLVGKLQHARRLHRR
jgi:hypothetical protein